MDRLDKDIVRNAFDVKDEGPHLYLCRIMRTMYGVCCDYTTAENLSGLREPLCCDGRPHGMLN